MRANLTRIFKVFQVFTEYTKDGWLFLRHNGFSPFEAEDRRLSHKTIIETHTVEKGLALPKPRPHFGQEKIRALLDMNTGRNPPENELSRTMLLGALRDYRSIFATTPAPDHALQKRIDAFLATPATETAKGGVRRGIERVNVCDEAAITFLGNRLSVRDFAPRALANCEIEKVVDLAKRAPSQCNRQATRLHVYRDAKKIVELLDLQAGARGFMEAVPTLFVVTSEITAWGGPQQRNQPYVDGGIFANMLLLSLEAHGFVCCPLNLAVTHRTELKIKKIGNIPARERLIVMVAAGPPPEHSFRAANSPRYQFAEICSFHDEKFQQ